MKTQISITGQVNGNCKLKTAIITNDCTVKKHFQNFTLTFPTKKAAIKALSEGWKYLLRNEDNMEWAKSISGISYSRGYSLSYDASVAKIYQA